MLQRESVRVEGRAAAEGGGWRRAGAREYSTAVDMWSLGCIMAELLTKEVLFDGKGELDQLQRIFALLGSPSEKIWPGLAKLPNVSKVRPPPPPPFPALHVPLQRSRRF